MNLCLIIEFLFLLVAGRTVFHWADFVDTVQWGQIRRQWLIPEEIWLIKKLNAARNLIVAASVARNA